SAERLALLWAAAPGARRAAVGLVALRAPRLGRAAAKGGTKSPRAIAFVGSARQGDDGLRRRLAPALLPAHLVSRQRFLRRPLVPLGHGGAARGRGRDPSLRRRLVRRYLPQSCDAVLHLGVFGPGPRAL